MLGQNVVQAPRPGIPGGIESAVDRTKSRIAKPAEEFVHRRHDVRVRIEGTASETDIDRVILTEAAHQVLAPADHTHGKPSREAFAIGHHVCAHADILLGAARGEPEADEYLLEDQDDIALAAHLPQRLQPLAVPGAIELTGS